MSTEPEVPSDATEPAEPDGRQGTHIGLTPADIAPVLRHDTQTSLPEPIPIVSMSAPGLTDEAACLD